MYPCPEFSLDHHCVDETQNFSRSCIQSNNQFHHLCIGACRIHQCSARATRNIQDNMGMTMGHADGVADSFPLGLEPEARSQWLRVTIIMIVSRVHTVHTHAVNRGGNRCSANMKCFVFFCSLRNNSKRKKQLGGGLGVGLGVGLGGC